MMTIGELSIEEKIGQMLCLGWQGDDAYLNVNAQARRCVGELHAGGMILFARNVQASGEPKPTVDVARVREMITELQRDAKIPLFIAVDQEGGRVARFGAPFTPFPSAKIVGQVNDVNLARKAAIVSGTELQAVGVNFNFAPIADIDSNPLNPVIADRSFSSQVDVVVRMVTAQVAGYAETETLSCAKHFPGHGDTHVDSHLALPTLAHSRAQMDQRELVPFRAVIYNGIPAIMTAHILFPALDDSGVPATLSKPILTDLLRDELGFTGLIVTDCLQMKAVADTWGTPRAAVMAAKAGADVLLVCHSAERQQETFDALLAAVHSGELSEERVDASVRRVLQAKSQLSPKGVPSLSVIGSEPHTAVSQQIYTAGDVPFAEPIAPTLGEYAF